MKYILHERVQYADLDGVRAAILAGEDLNALDELGNSPLHWAVLGGHDDIVELLLASGANPNVMSGDGFTPKWSAEDFGLNEIIEILTKYNGKVLSNENFDRTPWKVFKGFLGQSLPDEEN
jgi:ankyrin repeat protein